jgi:hypothetical protein
MIVHWMRVGFVHGVMNTDNMSILGLTIDYGPFGFLDSYQSAFVCNHSDELGRYAYDQQPRIGLFNLSCLAQAMLPLIDADSGEAAAEQAKQLLGDYQSAYLEHYYRGMASKLGLQAFQEGDQDLFSKLFAAMEGQVDFTNLFRALCHFDETGNNDQIRDMFVQREQFDDWSQNYLDRLENQGRDADARRQSMLATNPKYILRNYLAQQAITRAEGGDFGDVDELRSILQNPYDEQPGAERFAEEPPDWARHLDLSCSS